MMAGTAPARKLLAYNEESLGAFTRSKTKPLGWIQFEMASLQDPSAFVC
jgi:hypothetical protein